MEKPIDWIDYYTCSKHRNVLTATQIGISGLETFGKHSLINATEALPLHFHRNSFEIVYIARGHSVFSIDDKNYKLSGGDIFLTKPNQHHSTNANPISVCEMYWFQLSIKADTNLLNLNSSASVYLISKLSSIVHHKISTNSNEMTPLIKSAFDILFKDKNSYLASQYLSLFVHKLIEYSEQTMFKLTPDIGHSIEYIIDNITEVISLNELALISFLSTSQFKQKFKNQLGISPRQFINLQKIEYSKSLLLEKSNITDVSSILNFDNSSYFSVVFKRFNSCSPSQYIKKNTPRA